MYSRATSIVGFVGLVKIDLANAQALASDLPSGILLPRVVVVDRRTGRVVVLGEIGKYWHIVLVVESVLAGVESEAVARAAEAAGRGGSSEAGCCCR